MTKTQQYLELAARCYVFVMLNIYGTGKLVGGQFYRKGSLPEEVGIQTLDTVKSFDLAWTFMGHSYMYILFIGVSQLLGAWLLLWDRTKLLGIAILIPILVNIMVFDAIFFETYGALGSATIYFLLLMLVLFFNRNTIQAIIEKMLSASLKQNFEKNVFIKFGIVFGLMAVLFGIDQLVVNILGH